MYKIVTIATFTYPSEIAIIKGRLESDGIECFVKDELTVQVNNFYSNAIGGIKLQVRQNDVEQALIILKNLGYIKKGVQKKQGFWTRFNDFSKNIPFIKHQSPEIRLFLLTAFILIALSPVVYLMASPRNDYNLTKHNWCIDHIVYQGKAYKPSSPKIKKNQFSIQTNLCENHITFSDQGKLSLPGFNSSRINGYWFLDSDELEIYEVDNFSNIFDGYYHVESNGQTLTLISDSTVIYCYSD